MLTEQDLAWNAHLNGFSVLLEPFLHYVDALLVSSRHAIGIAHHYLLSWRM
jgi:hypothetical protein